MVLIITHVFLWAPVQVLFASLQGREAFLRPPYHRLRHPMIFYYGHPAVLYINKLRVAGIINEAINSHFEIVSVQGHCALCAMGTAE